MVKFDAGSKELALAAFRPTKTKAAKRLKSAIGLFIDLRPIKKMKSHAAK